jgi:peptidoglycan/LPS O-acetylase OafA/YrhL
VNKLAYIPALDGLRAIAVVAVMLYHLGLPGFDFGFVGVDLFFVLSGFLITSLLVTEHYRTGRINLPQFYLRRALRLFPALLVVLATALILALLFGSAREQSTTITGIWSSLLYISNWVLVLMPDANLGPLNSMWSLAVEDQFYIIWTPIIAFLLARHVSKSKLLLILLLATLASTSAGALNWYLAGTFPGPALGTHSRAQGLLLGCMLGLLYVWGRFPTRARPLMICALTVALSFTFLLTLHSDTALYTTGYLIIAVGAGGLIVLAVSSPHVARILSFKPLVWVGSISYALYLWHLLIFWYMSSSHTGLDPIVAGTLGFVLAFLSAAASYYLVERYFLQLKKRLAVRPTTPVTEHPQQDVLLAPNP